MIIIDLIRSMLYSRECCFCGYLRVIHVYSIVRYGKYNKLQVLFSSANDSCDASRVQLL